MRKLTNLLLVASLIWMTVPVWGQASTEGKDFWVANTIICQPPTASSAAFPTIAVSAQKACKVTITDYSGNQLAAASVTAGSWTRFGDNTASVDPADYYLDPSKWYPTTNNINATDAYKHADKINNYGLHITATENISVYVIMRTPQYSMDASNALPITALQSEYYLQDFYPDANGVDKPVTMTTILATENNTEVVITPRGNTYGKTNDGTPYSITLNQGQTYYMISDVNSQLAGTHILAQKGKKIAVYVGSPVTRLPGGVAARDGLFEQMMPIDYWGTQFIATRSMQKDANIIGITATQNGTELKIDGFTQTFLNEGDTYYILLQGAADPYNKNLAKITCHIDQVITADEAYIETSCPCAVISYDTGNSFAGATGSEIVNGQGDPSSVWISPVQQKINRITFGACYTKKTKAHFLNIVTETTTCTNTKLTAYMGSVGNDWSNKLSWTVVPGNPKYSYARVQIGNDTESINVFTLENENGFIAHVYGNGEDESYAYSAGSAAVEQGVKVNGETFINGYRSDKKYCFGDTIFFDAKVGTDEIARVDWNFGDGTSEDYGKDTTSHTYTSPGWYDVTATLWGRQVCTDVAEQVLGTVSFSFRIVRPDTIKHVVTDACVAWDYVGPDTYWDTVPYRCDSIVMTKYITRRNSKPYEYYETATGSFTLGGITFTHSTDTTWTTKNRIGCDSTITCHITILKCLDMQMSDQPDKQTICAGETLEVAYSYDTDGKPGKATFVINGTTYPLIISATEDNGRKVGTFVLPTDKLAPGKYVGKVYVEDITPDCQNPYESPDLNITITYPEDVLAVKFNNVLAVYKKGYGGNTNYEFSYYQFYRNGIALTAMTEDNIYHLGSDATFEKGDVVFVMLCDNEGNCLPSCPITIQSVDDYHIDSKNIPVRKTIVNQRIYITVDGQTYDCYGQRVE